MADMTPAGIGQINSAGARDALFLKQFAGEVLTAFAEVNVAQSRHMVRTITSGKSAQFPATWKGTAAYHTPGTQLLGTGVAANERVITIDDLLVADRSIAQIEEAKNHYDVRSIYSRDVGMSLSRTFDRQVLQVMVLAARASATVTGGNGGTVLTDAAFATTAANLEAGAFLAAQTMDEKDIPENDRYLFLRPAQYYGLINSGSKAIHSDYNPSPAGGYAQGKIYRIAGLEIVKTNNLPNTNITTGPSAYQGNFTTTVALAAQKGAAGTVKLMDLSVEMDWLIEYQTTLIVGKYAVGHGILRPECAIELKTA